MTRRGLMIANALKSGDLPSGYTALEYLQSTGTQYIDTGFKPNQDTRAVVDCNIAGTMGSYGCFGARDYTNSRSFWFGKASSAYKSCYFAYKQNSQATTLAAGYCDARHTFDANKNKLYIDGTQVVSLATATFSVNYNFFLFAMNDDYQSSGNPQARLGGTITLYSAKIYDNDVLVRDFVPCLDRSNIPCLYDKVNKQTYYNVGTGTFNYG